MGLVPLVLQGAWDSNPQEPPPDPARELARAQAQLKAFTRFEYEGGTAAINQLSKNIGNLQQTAPSAGLGLSREQRFEVANGIDSAGNAYNANHKPYGVAVYELNGKVYYAKPVEGDLHAAGNWTERYQELPKGAKLLDLPHWHMPGQISFSRLDEKWSKSVPVGKNYDPIRGANHNNYYGAKQQYDVLYGGMRYLLSHNRDIISQQPY